MRDFNKYQHTYSAGGVVLNSKGQVLVVSQHGTSWSLPKGHIDPGEEKLEAAVREIYEESGITDLSLVKELGVYSRYRIGINGGEDKSELKTIYMFLFKTGEQDLIPVDPENPEAKWIDKDRVVGLLTHEQDKDFFSGIINLI